MSVSCDLCDKLFDSDHAVEQHKRDTYYGNCTTQKKRSRPRNRRKNTQSTPTYSSIPVSANGYSSLANWNFNSFFARLGVGVREESQAVATGRNTVSVDFRSRVTATDLNSFIAEELQPTEEFNREMQETVGKICEFLRRHMEPDQIVKGGSLGKGTAVRGRCDIDLVLVLNGVEGAEDLKRKLPEIRVKIKTMLTIYSGGFTIVPGSLKDSSFLVKFSVKGTHGNIDVDLLPTFKYEDLQSLYRKMRTDQRHSEYYSVALAQRKVAFVGRQPANVKNLIRLVKYWKKEKVTSMSGGSYLMELITIHLWEENTRYGNGTFDTLKAFHGVMKALEEYHSLNVIWTTNYSASEIPHEVKSRPGPLVMDPANPMNNVCTAFDLERLGRAAREVRRSPMLDGVSSTSWK
ncbi:2'-5'-oligoadenylate synthase 3-like [Dendronephthya gigantea]|uniref:2'-5'-oligoadenylate synthase 3-like n=1 Tax=Dendronephthya gigantea TaxID=151771 RepID=UPI00106C6313|nr:2'-5'-oligoadenylate synthase 3-like [Dendronephthya gigantea]